MISLTIKDTKSFMSHLLVKNTFDSLYLSQADISTANNFSINGQINKNFYTNEEFEQLSNKKYSLWKDIKPICFNLIKGTKVPSSMKIIFLLTDSLCSDLISNYTLSFSPENINALFLNINYVNGQVHIVTGSSLNIFTLDKTLDSAFDDYIKKHLFNSGIDFEEF